MSSSPSSSSPSRQSTPGTEMLSTPASTGSPVAAMDNDKRFERLKFLVKQSKIYAKVLSDRLKEPRPDGEEAEEAEEEEKENEHPSKRRKSSRGEAIPIQQESRFQQPAIVSGATMHDYQLQGVQWLVSLYENGLNGILADEMGLGKTIQTIAFIGHLIENGITGPFLIVAPLSTLQNWMNEFERFAPQISAVKYHGDAKERDKVRRGFKGKHVVVTSYEIVVRDAAHLRNRQWCYVVVDEGHRLKNMNCRLIKELKRFDSANRLLLTGTPLQNNLAELWSLLNFLLPDIFADLEMFQAWFDEMAGDSHEKDVNIGAGQGSLVTSLHDILRPFLLRRIKTDVNLGLPDKREYIIYAGLTTQQKELYESILNKNARDYIVDKILESRGSADQKKAVSRRRNARQTAQKQQDRKVLDKASRRSKRISYEDVDDDEYFDKLEQEVEELEENENNKQDDGSTEKMIRRVEKESGVKSLQNMVMQLRLACNSPYLFYYPWTEEDRLDDRIVKESGKMILLDKLMTALMKKGHKMLIFSQFTKMLNVIEDWLTDYKQMPVCRIDGSTALQERQEQIDSFNNDDEYNVFLLSTRAGGLGINLTAADSVIIFDSDWNPQMDLQAIDRVHRLGQTKPVVVYRLATLNTVETRLLDRAASKRRLEQLVIERGRFKGLTLFDDAADESSAIALLTKQLRAISALGAPVERGSITDRDMKVLLDRSPEAYKRARSGAETLSENISSPHHHDTTL